MKRFAVILSLLLLAPLLWSPLYGSGKQPFCNGQDTCSPSLIIENAATKTLQILEEAELDDQQNTIQLQDQLIKKLEQLFDFRTMTRWALGSHARTLNSDQIEELARVFGPILQHIYASRLTNQLKETGGSHVRVRGIEVAGHSTDGRYATVRSRVRLAKDQSESQLSLNYKLVETEGIWTIYDLEIEGVSLISNYRSQFSQILSNGSYEDLLGQLQQKLEQIRNNQRAKQS